MTAAEAPPLTLVAAVARNGVIGAEGGLPWRLPGDLAQFRAVTMGHPLLMGRATFASIGHPLPGRSTTVLSRDPAFAPAGVTVAPDLAAALDTAAQDAAVLGANTIIVAGGAAVYAATIDRAHTLLITEVDASPVGDAVFPAIDARLWRRAEIREATPRPEDEFTYRFVRWERTALRPARREQ